MVSCVGFIIYNPDYLWEYHGIQLDSFNPMISHVCDFNHNTFVSYYNDTIVSNPLYSIYGEPC